ncbi:helix-turn-helix domain-containing protein [Chitinophaga sp. SYP-B3965]|uniref:GlxA family transcriptional regulator n=1 Tax=Chitinophaga sp. SYP-B3965 TaxID=2663120 RepID=UPI001299D6DF|nr:helix-turn-helix domain-containing protein [Chitinophaga sp. SYP-B3965]MRG48591.1 helix-turn-helix domain-containing protein [Chitinophaga sp. SYP-B3965]
MKLISIVVPSGGVLSNIEFPRQVFTEINDYLAGLGKAPIFKIQFVGVCKSMQLNDGLFTVQTDITIDEARKTDLIIIPAVYGDVHNHVKNNLALIEWMREQYAKGAELASLCVGAFLLAGTGLLTGRKCATHWKAANNFRNMYPDVKLVVDKIITDEAGIYSSGGGISFLNLIVYLVEKYAGKDAAVYCAKFFQVDTDRYNQSPFSIFQGQKDHSDEPVKQAQTYIENNFQQKITVDQLAGIVSVGKRSLERRFKKATANTLNEYTQRVKIEAAKKHLEMSSKKIMDIMYEVGYSDTKTFRTSFKMVTGLLPKEYRNKYNRVHQM